MDNNYFLQRSEWERCRGGNGKFFDSLPTRLNDEDKRVVHRKFDEIRNTSSSSSSSDSDSSVSSSSSYEYEWQEAEPAKAAVQPAIVKIGGSSLPGIQRGFESILPLKTMLVILFPNNTPDELEKGIDQLEIRKFTKKEAKLLTQFLKSLSEKEIRSITVGDDIYVTEYHEGDRACTASSLRAKYDSILDGLYVAAHNPPESDLRNAITKSQNVATVKNVVSNHVMSVKSFIRPHAALKKKKSKITNLPTVVQSLEEVKETEMKLDEKRDASPPSPVSTVAGSSYLFPSAKALLYTNQNVVDVAAISENSSSSKKKTQDPPARKNIVVLKHLFPENEEMEDSDPDFQTEEKNKQKTPDRRYSASPPTKLKNRGKFKRRSTSKDSANDTNRSLSACSSQDIQSDEKSMDSWTSMVSSELLASKRASSREKIVVQKSATNEEKVDENNNDAREIVISPQRGFLPLTEHEHITIKTHSLDLRETSKDGPPTEKIYLPVLECETSPKITFSLSSSNKSKRTVSVDVAFNEENAFKMDESEPPRRRIFQPSPTCAIEFKNSGGDIPKRPPLSDLPKDSESRPSVVLASSNSAAIETACKKEGGMSTVHARDKRDRTRHGSVARPSQAAIQRKQQNKIILRSRQCLQSRDRKQREKIDDAESTKSGESRRSRDSREKDEKRDNAKRYKSSPVHSKSDQSVNSRKSASRTPPRDSRTRNIRGGRDGSAGARSSSKDSIESSHRDHHVSAHQQKNYVPYAPGRNYPICPDYSKLKYTYSADLYSSLSSSEVDFGDEDDEDALPKRRVVLTKSSRDEARKHSRDPDSVERRRETTGQSRTGDSRQKNKGNKSESPRKNRNDLNSEAVGGTRSRRENRDRSHDSQHGTETKRKSGNVKYPPPDTNHRHDEIRRRPVNVENVDSVIPAFSDDIEKLVVSIRRDCEKRQVGRDSLTDRPRLQHSRSRRRVSRRRRSHSPSCTRTITPPNNGRLTRRTRRRSLSPVYHEPDPSWGCNGGHVHDGIQVYNSLQENFPGFIWDQNYAVHHAQALQEPMVSQFHIPPNLQGLPGNCASHYVTGNNAAQNRAFVEFERIWADNDPGNTRLGLQNAHYSVDGRSVVNAGVDCVGSANMISATNISEQALHYGYNSSFRPVQSSNMLAPQGHEFFNSGNIRGIGWPVNHNYQAAAAAQLSPGHDNEQQVIILKDGEHGHDHAKGEEDWPFLPNGDSCESSNEDSCDGEVESLMSSRILSIVRHKKNSGVTKCAKKSAPPKVPDQARVTTATSAETDTEELNKENITEVAPRQASGLRNEEVIATRKSESSGVKTDNVGGCKITSDVDITDGNTSSDKTHQVNRVEKTCQGKGEVAALPVSIPTGKVDAEKPNRPAISNPIKNESQIHIEDSSKDATVPTESAPDESTESIDSTTTSKKEKVTETTAHSPAVQVCQDETLRRDSATETPQNEDVPGDGRGFPAGKGAEKNTASSRTHSEPTSQVRLTEVATVAPATKNTRSWKKMMLHKAQSSSSGSTKTETGLDIANAAGTCDDKQTTTNERHGGEDRSSDPSTSLEEKINKPQGKMDISRTLSIGIPSYGPLMTETTTDKAESADKHESQSSPSSASEASNAVPNSQGVQPAPVSVSHASSMAQSIQGHQPALVSVSAASTVTQSHSVQATSVYVSVSQSLVASSVRDLPAPNVPAVVSGLASNAMTQGVNTTAATHTVSHGQTTSSCLMQLVTASTSTASMLSKFPAKVNIVTTQAGSISSDRIFSVARPTAITISTKPALDENVRAPRPTGTLASRSTFRGPQARKLKETKQTNAVEAAMVVGSVKNTARPPTGNVDHVTMMPALVQSAKPRQPTLLAKPAYTQARSLPQDSSNVFAHHLPNTLNLTHAVTAPKHESPENVVDEQISPAKEVTSKSDWPSPDESQDIGDALDLDDEPGNVRTLSTVKLSRYSEIPRSLASDVEESFEPDAPLVPCGRASNQVRSVRSDAILPRISATPKPLKSILYKPAEVAKATPVEEAAPPSLVSTSAKSSPLGNLGALTTEVDLSASKVLLGPQEIERELTKAVSSLILLGGKSTSGTQKKRKRGPVSKAVAKAKKPNPTSSRGRGRSRSRVSGGKGRNKRRKRLPSLSSDDDLIEELNAATVVVKDPEETVPQLADNEKMFSDSEEEDSDDGLVSFMEIGDGDKKTVEEVTAKDNESSSDNEGNKEESKESAKTGDDDDGDGDVAFETADEGAHENDFSATTEDINDGEDRSENSEHNEPDKNTADSQSPLRERSIVKDDENIFTKMSREMEAGTTMLDVEFGPPDAEFKDEPDVTVVPKGEALVPKEETPVPIEETPVPEEETSNNTHVEAGAVDDLQQHEHPSAKEGPDNRADRQSSRMLYRPYLSTPTQRVVNDSLLRGNQGMFRNNPGQMPNSSMNMVQPLLPTPPTSPKQKNGSELIGGSGNQPNIERPCSTNSLLKAAADEKMEKCATSDSGSAKKKRRRSTPAIEEVEQWRMPEGESCHGFLEVCMAVPDDRIYSLRRIPYVKTTSKGESDGISVLKRQWTPNDPQTCQERGGASGIEGPINLLPTSSACATYLRLRDVISLLKLQPDVLSLLTTKCSVKLSHPNEFTKRLYCTVYDPVCHSDPTMNKLTMRNKPGKRVQMFLDKMIILDEFLHTLLPKFYLEALDILSFDVPKYVNVKIFKPISNIDEEVVKIFRKPYEYNGVLQAKDDKVKCKSLKRKWSTAPRPEKHPTRPASVGEEVLVKRRKSSDPALERHVLLNASPSTASFAQTPFSKSPLEVHPQGFYLSRQQDVSTFIRGPTRGMAISPNASFAYSTSVPAVQRLYAPPTYGSPTVVNNQPAAPNVSHANGVVHLKPPYRHPFSLMPLNLTSSRAVGPVALAGSIRPSLPYVQNISRSTVIQSTGVQDSHAYTPEYLYHNMQPASLTYRVPGVSSPAFTSFANDTANVSYAPTVPRPSSAGAARSYNVVRSPDAQDLTSRGYAATEPDFTITSVFSLKKGRESGKTNDNLDQYSDITENSSDDDNVVADIRSSSLLTTKEFLMNASKVMNTKNRTEKNEGDTGLAQKLRSRNTMLKTGLTDAGDIPELGASTTTDKTNEISTESQNVRLKGITTDQRKEVKLLKKLLPETDADTGHLSGIVSKLKSRVQNTVTKSSKGKGKKKGPAGSKKTKGKSKRKQPATVENT